MFTVNSKGFSIKFANGITASVQFGEGNYCDNRFKEDSNTGLHSCLDAEIYAFDEDEKDILQPQGWQTPEMIVNILNDLSSRKSAEDL